MFREILGVCAFISNEKVDMIIVVFYMTEISNFCTSVGDMPYSVKSKSEH